MVFRIIATVLLGLSFISGGFKNLAVLGESKTVTVIAWTIYSIAWRAFVITAIWLIQKTHLSYFQKNAYKSIFLFIFYRARVIIVLESFRGKNMSNFIRAKDGTIFQSSYEENGYIYTINGFIGCRPDEIVKESENITDLFDEIVRYIKLDNEYRFIQINEPEALQRMVERIKSTGDEVYGMIWTRLPNGALQLTPKAQLTVEGNWRLL